MDQNGYKVLELGLEVSKPNYFSMWQREMEEVEGERGKYRTL